MQKNNRALIKPFVVALVATILVVLLMYWANYAGAVEQCYSNGIYPAVAAVLHLLFSFLPFSLGDMLYVAVVILIIYAAIRIIWHSIKGRFKKALVLLLRMAAGTAVAVLVFYFFWGMNYYRPSLGKRLNLKDTTCTVADLKHITLMMIDSTNATRGRLSKADMQQPVSSIYNTAITATNQLAQSMLHFTPRLAAVKPSLLSPFISYLYTSGYYNPFTGEAQINYCMPAFTKPFVVCHELSHQMGVGPEDEANFTGFVAGIKSNDKLLRYSAYYNGMFEFMIALRGADSVTYKSYKKRISPAVKADLKAEHEFWMIYQGRLEALSSVFYDNFLKANNQPRGLQTYNRMILLTAAWYRNQHKK